MTIFRKAERRKSKLRLGISGPSGAGKTYSALAIASGLAPWEKIAVIDSENGSADLYAQLGDYSVLTLTPPYTPEKYIEAIKAAEQEGFEVIIIDSLTHAWAGEGGILDQQGKATDTKYRGNSWSAWREFTPKHNQLVETMLKSKCHIIATMRSKIEYIQTEENGKKRIQRIGMSPIQRDGMEYEFTVFLDLSLEHIATATKDRTSMFDGQYFKPDQGTGRALLTWLNSGTDSPAPQPVQWPQPGHEYQAQTYGQQPVYTQPAPEPPATTFPAYHNEITQWWQAAGWTLEQLSTWIFQRFQRPPAQLTHEECHALAIEIMGYAQQKMGGQ
ncbi:hypothetical protein SCACP_21600 [Sporomusa carbonis]|uniref:ATP-binding protein n=1 Tax=Sporomusa carbonis TaxID=3076075 RepID=UPI003A79DE9E